MPIPAKQFALTDKKRDDEYTPSSLEEGFLFLFEGEMDDGNSESGSFRIWYSRFRCI